MSHHVLQWVSFAPSPCLDMGPFTTGPHWRLVQRCLGQVGRRKEPHFQQGVTHLCCRAGLQIRLPPSQSSFLLIFSLAVTLQPFGDSWPRRIHSPRWRSPPGYAKLANTDGAANPRGSPSPTGFNALKHQPPWTGQRGGGRKSHFPQCH